MDLKNKTILLISPQAWGTMHISKHHYAITLSRLGNKVFFLNPPNQNIAYGKHIEILPSQIYPGLSLIYHRLRFPFLFKFHALPVFHWFMRFHIKGILKTMGISVDIVWSFDQGNLYPFKFFGKKPFKIFQAVDEPGDKMALAAAQGSDLILSVTKEIVEKYTSLKRPCHLINHGIGEDFFLPFPGLKNGKKKHVGFSGNLLRADIDKDVLLKIISDHPQVVFEFWGSYKISHANLGGLDNDESRSFIHSLHRHNVILHGPVSQTRLANELQRMDAFLICYDIKKDQSKGTNYHKIIEYLNTGKVIIASNITTYQHQPALIQMVKERDSNCLLPALFTKVMSNLEHHNSLALQQQRKAFARMNTYVKQVERIQDIIGSLSQPML